MLPREKLPVDVGGLTPEMTQELEERIAEFEANCEAEASQGGAGYVPKIRKADIIGAGIINLAITVYLVIAVIIM